MIMKNLKLVAPTFIASIFLIVHVISEDLSEAGIFRMDNRTGLLKNAKKHGKEAKKYSKKPKNAVKKSKNKARPDSCKDAVDPNTCYANRCLEAYNASGYNYLATTKFANWLNQDSVLEYAGAGIYTGVDGIAEYVNFFIDPLFYSSIEMVDTVENIQLISAKKDKCVILTADHERSVFNGVGIPVLGIPALTSGKTIDFVLGQKVEFQVRGDDDNNILIKQNDLYFPPGFATTLFSQGTLAIAEAFCKNIMFDKCPAVWKANFGTDYYPTDPSQNPCLGAFARIPPFEPPNDPTNASIDGNSIGCRLLHGSFAFQNDIHCPHISFTPISDEKGSIKCQTSQLKTIADSFTEEELEFMNAAAETFGLDNTLPFSGIQITA
mmetsp:Transcript_37332/g.42664  ORF Transcript_37332/g.42664 Transcript_37332/m.42664 type:complete len:380 (-) Transcript_37332:272-1411(-)|eukprot:CAMPEP_0194131714 /NCGR_PEP_ID=MMETSP0152-20130528/2421_1 /TAXON_ID=1049557 /ORGANISM="Thalassiothrix antarctica, Strain L6-D1" /LENGTH=379 /DNA_ID=CAMNT_0038826583 /DNA_START=29 /DNA_END=1168 /DNA_ORIENTATION=+